MKNRWVDDPEAAREAGRKGGHAVPPELRPFSRNPELARIAGRKGGVSLPREKRGFFANRELAREAGRKGGQARRKPRQSLEGVLVLKDIARPVTAGHFEAPCVNCAKAPTIYKTQIERHVCSLECLAVVDAQEMNS